MSYDTAPSGWYQDPTAQADGRYWDGAQWTDTVTRAGVTIQSPMDPLLQQVPPVPGTEMGAPAATTAPAPAPSPQPAQSSSTGTVITIVIALAIGAGLLVFFLGNDSSDDPSPDTPVTEAPPATTSPPATTAAPATTA